jgi:hypothetical protein
MNLAYRSKNFGRDDLYHPLHPQFHRLEHAETCGVPGSPGPPMGPARDVSGLGLNVWRTRPGADCTARAGSRPSGKRPARLLALTGGPLFGHPFGGSQCRRERERVHVLARGTQRTGQPSSGPGVPAQARADPLTSRTRQGALVLRPSHSIIISDDAIVTEDVAIDRPA